jgi:hypothetical protein
VARSEFVKSLAYDLYEFLAIAFHDLELTVPHARSPSLMVHSGQIELAIENQFHNLLEHVHELLDPFNEGYAS